MPRNWDESRRHFNQNNGVIAGMRMAVFYFSKNQSQSFIVGSLATLNWLPNTIVWLTSLLLVGFQIFEFSWLSYAKHLRLIGFLTIALSWPPNTCIWLAFSHMHLAGFQTRAFDRLPNIVVFGLVARHRAQLASKHVRLIGYQTLSFSDWLPDIALSWLPNTCVWAASKHPQ